MPSTRLVGPLPELSVLVPAVLGVLDVVAVVAPHVAPPAAGGVGALAVALTQHGVGNSVSYKLSRIKHTACICFCNPSPLFPNLDSVMKEVPQPPPIL